MSEKKLDEDKAGNIFRYFPYFYILYTFTSIFLSKTFSVSAGSVASVRHTIITQVSRGKIVCTQPYILYIRDSLIMIDALCIYI